jgi:hypothetical protein
LNNVIFGSERAQRFAFSFDQGEEPVAKATVIFPPRCGVGLERMLKVTEYLDENLLLMVFG